MAFFSDAASDIRNRFRQWWPGAYGSTKHNYQADFGWPCDLSFEQFLQMYRRNSLATAAVDKTILKTWATAPELWLAPDKPADTPIEQDIANHFAKAGIWRALMTTDKRGMVGAYSAGIIRVRDGRPWSTPVTAATLEDILGVIPCWEAQLQVEEWEQDERLDTYGQPRLYRYDKKAVEENPQALGEPFMPIKVHPSRVLIWSEDGTIAGRSDLEPGFNDLIDIEKIKGAGGEGFWKSSRGAPIITAPQGMSYADVRRAMGGTSAEDTKNKLDTKLDDFQSGFDKGLMLGGMDAKVMTITLPQPKEFLEGPVQQFAASMGIPYKELIGNVTGERASTEDAKGWAQTCNSRRENLCKPVIATFVERMVAWGAVPEGISIGWESLLEASPDEKLDRAVKMATAQKGLTELLFLPDEIREAGGFAASEDVEGWDEYEAEKEEKAAELAAATAPDETSFPANETK